MAQRQKGIRDHVRNRSQPNVYNKAISQQALSQRLLTFPASMFEKVLEDLLVPLNQKWQQRQKRKCPLGIAQAKKTF